MQGITFLANEHLEVGHKIADGKRKKDMSHDMSFF